MSTTPSASQSRITTAEELLSLAPGTIVRACDGRPIYRGEGSWVGCTDGPPIEYSPDEYLPGEVLYPLPAAPPVSDATAELGGLYLAATEDAIKALGIPDGDDEPMPADVEACGCDGEMGLRHLIWHLAQRSDATAATITSPSALADELDAARAEGRIYTYGQIQRLLRSFPADVVSHERYLAAISRLADEEGCDCIECRAFATGRIDAVLAALGLTVTERSEVLTDETGAEK